MYIYIYIKRETERDRDRERDREIQRDTQLYAGQLICPEYPAQRSFVLI